jgi:hypothetical protein
MHRAAIESIFGLQASELAVARSAVLLLPGAWLDWTLPGLTRYVLPLE